MALEEEDYERILEDISDEERAKTANKELLQHDGNFSDGEEELVNESDHDSSSEIEVVDSDDDQSDQESALEYFLGKDKSSKWYKATLRRPTSRHPARNITRFSPGGIGSAREITTELEAFNLFISTEMIDDIVKFTNICIERRMAPQYSRKSDCLPTTREEIMALFGILYMLGIKGANHTNVQELWCNDGTGMILLRACMKYNRFYFLLRSMRFDNHMTRQERRTIDKLAPIREFVDKFTSNCKTNYCPGNFVTLDEKLEAFRGRCSFVQYIPNKPAKFGIKVFALCDSKTYYTSNLEIYCGKQPDGPYCVSNKPTDVVNRMITGIEGENRNLTTDNWYTSYPLAVSLLEKGITFIGTVRKNKKEIPVEFLPNKVRTPRSSIFGFQKDISMVSYVPRKNRAVVLISTMHDTGDIHEVTGKPMHVMDYNKTKGGVDTVDQMCSKYSVSRTTRRWPMAIFYSFLNIAGINAKIIVDENKSERVLRRTFLKNLSLSLMESHLKRRALQTSLRKDVQLFLQKYKDNTSIDTETEEPARKKKGRCQICGRAKNINTTVHCSVCGNFVCKNHSVAKVSCEVCSNDRVEESE